jgi:hypothetical protein
MWIFSKHGHLNVVQQESEPDSLVVQSRTKADIDGFVALLHEAGGNRHEVQAVGGDYRFQVTAARQEVAAAVARLVGGIDYSSLMRSVTFDFGTEQGYVLFMRPDGLQVARVNPE